MFRLFVLVLLATSSIVLADTELSQGEILEILKKLTAKKTEAWISSGAISADHEEYRAPEIMDANQIEIEVKKAVKEHGNKGKGDKELEVVPFNTQYRLGNSCTMSSKQLVRFDGEKYYWQIEIDSRKDSIKPNYRKKSNRFATYFDMDCNKIRIFAWDGEKNTRYYNPCNQVAIENNPSNVNGPLTAGYIPWGLGYWSYEELKNCQLNATKNDEDEIHIKIQGENYTRHLILDEALEYTVKSFELKNKLSGEDTYYNYLYYKKISDGWVPRSITIEKYKNQRLCEWDFWAKITVDETPLSEDDFIVEFDSDAVINDCRFGSEVLRYIYAPTIPPEARNNKKYELIAEREEYLAQKSGIESNCAISSVWLSCRKIGRKVSLSEIRSKIPVVKGHSLLADMKKMIDSVNGLSAIAVKGNISDLAKLKNSQVILYLPAEKHFVNLISIERDRVCLADIDSSRYTHYLCHSGFKKNWKGVALLISDSDTKIQGQFASLNTKESQKVSGASVCHECSVEQKASEDDQCASVNYECNGDKIKLYSLHRCTCDNDNTCTIMTGEPVLNKETWKCEEGADLECDSIGEYQAFETKSCEPIE